MTSPPPKVDGTALPSTFRAHLRHLPVTHQCDAIAETIFCAVKHPSVGDIERGLQIRGVSVGMATISDAPDLLLDAGLVLPHDLREGFKRDGPPAPLSRHEHLLCILCGKVVKFSSESLVSAKRFIADEHGSRYHHQRLEIYGDCRECQRRDAITLEARTTRREDPTRC